MSPPIFEKMGAFSIEARFYNLREEGRSIILEALVDTGSTFSGLPAPTSGI